MIDGEGNPFTLMQGCTTVKKWLIVLLLVVLAGCGAYFWWGLTGVHPLSEKSLTFAEVRQATIRDTISATGMVEPREIIIVSAEIPGTILRISPREEKSSIPLNVGDIVFEGMELAQLDARRMELKVKEAEAGIELAKSAVLQAQAALTQAKALKVAADRQLDVQKDLQKAGGFRTEREQAEAQVKAAIAGIEVADAGIELAKAKQQAAETARKEAVLARNMAHILVPGKAGKDARPFLILDRKVNVGQMVGPQSGPLFTLAGSLDIVEVHAQVVEGDRNKIREGLPAIFKVGNYDDEDGELKGFIKRINPLSSTIKGAVYYDAVIEVQNRKDPKTKDWQLHPGMTVPIDIVRHEHAKAWRVPSAALNFKLEEAYQSESAKSRIAEWKKRADANDWYALWTWDSTARQTSPVFVRIGAKQGEVALKDSEGNEILEWEPGKEPTGELQIIIGAPPARPPGFFDQPANVKL